MTGRSKQHRPVMRYHGGKFLLAPWIVNHLPRHRTYVEPFGGAASVLMAKRPAYAEIYNDLDGEIVNVFRVLRDATSAEALRLACELTPYARTEFALAYEPSNDPIEQARRTIFRSFAGHGSAAASGYNTGFRANATRSHTTPCDDWRRWPASIPTFVARLRHVIVEQMPAADLISRHDRPDTLFYVDPPYVHSTRNTTTNGGSQACYRHEMNDDDHAALLDQLLQIDGMVVLSGHPSPLYAQRLRGWHCIKRDHFGDGRSLRTEALWLNPAAVDRKQQRSLFDAPTRVLEDL